MSSLPNFSLIAAVTAERAIGYEKDLPWKDTPIPSDMRYFELCTQYVNTNNDDLFPSTEPIELDEPKNVVIMGRLTWESMPCSVRPFKNRFCIIVSRNPDLTLEMKNEKLRKYTFIVSSLPAALELSSTLVSEDGSVYVIGGSNLYKEASAHPNCKILFLTELFGHAPFLADTFFPEYKGESFNWDQGTNLTKEAITWMDKYPLTRRRLPVLTSADLQNDSIGPFLQENGISYRFIVYRPKQVSN